MEVFIFARFHAAPDQAAFDLHAGLAHTVRFVAEVEPLLDHPFKASLMKQIW